MFAKTISNVMTRPSTNEGIGFTYVLNYYKLFGLTLYTQQEILALAG